AGIGKNEDGMRSLDGDDAWVVTVAVPGGFSDWVRAASLVVRNLKAVGIEAKLETYDFNAWFENLQKGQYMLSMGWSEVHPSPYFLYRGMMSTKTRQPIGEMAAENWHRFALPESDAIFDQLERISDKNEE